MPFGEEEERADLRSAITGAVVANEVRAIAGGLAGKRLDAIQIGDLMINSDKGSGKGKGRRSKKGKANDRDIDAGAEAYARSWEASIKKRLAEAQSGKDKKQKQ